MDVWIAIASLAGSVVFHAGLMWARLGELMRRIEHLERILERIIARRKDNES